jgi:hypothetical protein
LRSTTIPYHRICIDYDAYHFVGSGDFSHEISGCGDPRGGTAAIYPTVSKCQRALKALTLQSPPYDPNYVEGPYSDYTCSDDNFYPKTKGKVEESSNLSSEDSALTGSGYVIDSDSDVDMLMDTSSYVNDDDIYPLACGEIKDDSRPPIVTHCMMPSHDDQAKAESMEAAIAKPPVVESSHKPKFGPQDECIWAKYLSARIRGR